MDVLLAAYKNKGVLKQDDLRRRREEQQVEIRRQKREENISKRRIFLPASGADSDDEVGSSNFEQSVSRNDNNLVDGALHLTAQSFSKKWSPLYSPMTPSVSLTRRPSFANFFLRKRILPLKE